MSRKNNYIGADKGFKRSMYAHQLPDSKRRIQVNKAKSRVGSWFHPAKADSHATEAFEMLTKVGK